MWDNLSQNIFAFCSSLLFKFVLTMCRKMSGKIMSEKLFLYIFAMKLVFKNLQMYMKKSEAMCHGFYEY